MDNLWSDEEASTYEGDLGLRVYTSRLLGRDQSLVLHGGGNTSVKINKRNLLGDEETLLYVKGSGWDLETIEADGFAPVHLEHLVRLASLAQLDDISMVNELRTHMTQANAPTPSVEAILHAIIPHKFVDHTHADAIVTITNTDQGMARIEEIYGDDVVIIPYIMPGFDLARDCAARFAAEAGPNTLGMVLLNHGIFSFAETAKESYQRMIELVQRAEDYLQQKNAWHIDFSTADDHQNVSSLRIERATLRLQASKAAGFPLIMRSHNDVRSRFYLNHPELERISQQGPATPDHVIRTKSLPQLGRDVTAYCQQYKAYFDRYAPLAKTPRTMLDPAPRLILDQQLGLCTLGRTTKDSAIVADIFEHTIDVILRAEALGGYRALPAADLFDMEYWDLEQAKLKRAGSPAIFAGEIALITGAASGIGKACCAAMLERGAAVIGLDVAASISTTFSSPAFLGLVCDITDSESLESALEEGVATFGGLDMLIMNAGVFPAGKTIAELDDDQWRRVFSVNLDAHLALMRLSFPLLECAPNGGRVVSVGSRNVTAPGPGAAAYSASKAALTQLSRIAALEWGNANIRINTLHPDAVFDTALWQGGVLEARAQHYGMTPAEYKTRNILKTEVTSKDVAELAANLCGPLFSKTTGAQIPIDGGNDRVI